MTQPRTSPPSPADDALDRLLDGHLAASEELAPSSGFLASVMESVHAQATEPLPIAFPWRRVVPGVIAVLCGLLAFVVFAFHGVKETAKPILPVAHFSGSISWQQLTHAVTFTPHAVTLCWILLAACLSVAAVATSFRLTGHSE